MTVWRIIIQSEDDPSLPTAHFWHFNNFTSLHRGYALVQKNEIQINTFSYLLAAPEGSLIEVIP